jgi:hypothetical protein
LVPDAVGSEDASFEAFFAVEWGRLFRLLITFPYAAFRPILPDGTFDNRFG